MNLRFAICDLQLKAKRKRRSAFSFAEVMFAVIILGVGFIMIAALFPVAIRQSKSNTDETNSAAIARGATNIVDALSTQTGLMSSATVFALPSSKNPSPAFTNTSVLWYAIRDNVISADDPRYAWVPFYFRGTDPQTLRRLPYAQLILVCVQSTIKPLFDKSDVQWPDPANLTQRSNLQGRPVQIKIADGNAAAGDPDLIGFGGSALADKFVVPENARNAVAEGAFVIIRQAVPTPIPADGYRMIGRIYRVGTRRAEYDGQTYNSVMFTSTSAPMQVWELMPGYDFSKEPKDPMDSTSQDILNIDKPTEAWVVGRAFANNNYPVGADPTFEGPAMDVSVYSTFIYCKP